MQDLPDELLPLIFKSFAEIQDRDDPSGRPNTPSEEVKANVKTLASVSKVCVKWHELVQPILYSTFRKPAIKHPSVIRSDQIERFRGNPVAPSQNMNYVLSPLLRGQNEHTVGDRPNQTLRLLLRTIIEQPHLADHIKKLVLGSWVDVLSFRYGYPHRVVKPEPSLRQTYREALARLATIRRSPWLDYHVWPTFVNYVLDGYEGSELALLMYITPNLTTLHMAQVPVIEEWMVLGEHGLASRVSTIHLGAVDRMEHVQLIHLRTLMMLPHLRHLTFVNCSVDGYSQLPPSRLTHLSIQRCRISQHAFGLLMEHISNLESFEWIGIPYSQYHLDRRWIIHQNVLTQRVLGFISLQRPTLRDLRILGDGLGLGRLEQASFRYHDLLGRLTIQGRLLHEESICLSAQLPRSLRYLEVSHCCYHMMNKLVALVSARALPTLETIECTYAPWSVLPSQHLARYKLVVAELAKLCAAEGIVFVRPEYWVTP